MRDEQGRVMWSSIVVSIGALVLAIVHIARPATAIDSTTIALFGVAALPWLGAVLKSIELPGGFKAEFRERLETIEQRVETVEHAVFRGGTQHQQELLSAALEEYAAYLGEIGLPTEGPIPGVDLTGAPEGMISAYDPATNTILIDPRLADDPQSTQHEYSHVVLTRCGYVFEWGGPLHSTENALALYFVCAHAQSPRYLDTPGARLAGFEPHDLSRQGHVAELAEPDNPYQRAPVLAGVLWQTRNESAAEAFDRAAVAAWKAVVARPDAGEAAFAQELMAELERRNTGGGFGKRLSESGFPGGT